MSVLSAIPAALGSITLLQWIFMGVVLAAWIYYTLTKEYGKWEKRGMASIKPDFFFGNNKKLFYGQQTFITLHLDLYEKLKKYG